MPLLAVRSHRRDATRGHHIPAYSSTRVRLWTRSLPVALASQIGLFRQALSVLPSAFSGPARAVHSPQSSPPNDLLLYSDLARARSPLGSGLPRAAPSRSGRGRRRAAGHNPPPAE